MTKQLIDIAKEQGAIVEYKYINKDIPKELKQLTFTEAQLQATINAVNAQVSEPFTYLKFWARQYPIQSEPFIEHDDGFEVCKKDEIGDDGDPAFPVYIAPKTLPPEWAEYVERLERALDVCKYDCNTGEVIGIAQEAISSKPKDR